MHVLAAGQVVRQTATEDLLAETEILRGGGQETTPDATLSPLESVQVEICSGVRQWFGGGGGGGGLSWWLFPRLRGFWECSTTHFPPAFFFFF